MDYAGGIQTNPLFGIAATLAAYCVAVSLWQRSGNHALLHPVLMATIMVSCMLLATGMPYDEYFAQAWPLNEALSLVIVLLAVPLYRQFALIRQCSLSIVPSLLIGSATALIVALALPVWSDAGTEIVATLAPKSATAAVAAEISSSLGGTVGLTAVVVISTGITGAVFGPLVLKLSGVEDERAMGFALGVASHAIGTARAFQISEVSGAFASLGMILNALLTVIFAPLAVALINL